jgi:DNA repair photolyase
MWNGLLGIIEEIRKQRLKCSERNAYMVTEEQLHQLEKHISSAIALRRFLVAVLNSSKGSKMFNVVGETWNPITGCLHYCRYCWARYLAMTKLKNAERYRDGFKPRFNREEMRKNFKGGVVFVSDMGDIFSPGVRDEWIIGVIEYISKFPNTYFLFLTKNP